jgi:hypothetical protein
LLIPDVFIGGEDTRFSQTANEQKFPILASATPIFAGIPDNGSLLIERVGLACWIRPDPPKWPLPGF